MWRKFLRTYTVIGSPNRRGISYTYLLLQKAGNLLIGHQSRPSADEMDEIAVLGGVESQCLSLLFCSVPPIAARCRDADQKGAM